MTVDVVIDPAALDLLSSRLRTLLQIEGHLTLALETGYQGSEKPVNEAIIKSDLSKPIDDLEPTLARLDCAPKILGELLGTKQAEIKAMFRPPTQPIRPSTRRVGSLPVGIDRDVCGVSCRQVSIDGH